MSEPIRVVQVMGKMVGGGIEAVVMNYYRHIDHSRVQFDFLVDEDSTLVPREEIEALGGRVIKVPPYQQVGAYMRECEVLFRQEDWLIVHSHLNSLSVFPLRAAKRAGVPVRIAHSHSTSGRGEYAKNALKIVLKTQANRYPTHRLACSHFAGEWLFGEGAEFDVMYNAIDLGRFSFNAEVRAKERADLGIAGSTFVIGHLGRFMPQKNQRFLIDAFATFVETHPDSVLLLAGEGEQRPLAENRAIERGVSGKVRFLGQRSDVDRLYQAFDVFVLPSLYEGLGLVGIEAQRASLPCLLSDRITREVDVTGTCEFLPIADPMIWTKALIHVADTLGYDRGDLGPDGCFDLYDIEQAAPRLVEYYERALVEYKGV